MENKRTIWAEVVAKLIEKNLTIATMESCTGGGIANEITNISGASTILRECYVTYCNEAKIKLGVPAEIIEEYTVYSREVAICMAKAAKKQAGSDIAIGVTGQLGRVDPCNPNNEINCVWYAVVNNESEIFVNQIHVPNAERRFQKEFVIDAVAKTILSQVFNNS